MALVGVELETFGSEPDALTTRDSIIFIPATALTNLRPNRYKSS